MRRVLLVQPSLQPPGGSNGVAAWMLQALAPGHRVTVLSWDPVETGRINRFFGTHLRLSDFDTIRVPRMWTAVPDHLPVPAALIKSALLMRYTRRVSDAFEVIVGGHNETDFGRRGIQYIHYPTYLRPRPTVDLRWYHQSGALLERYYQLADWIADFSLERLETNLTLVNSDWTGARVRGFLGVDPITVYPPVVDPAPGGPWDTRRRGFLAVGRVAPEKEYERVMRILSRVRAHVPDLTLTIAGTWDRHTRRYAAGLQRLATSLGSWIEFRQDLSREDLRALMASHRYGIHGMREEHFGIAPAEMMRAGTILWVPRGGGQVEIVGDEPRLLYDTEEEAAENILRVITSPVEEQRMRDHLAARSDRFGTERFVQHIQSMVEAFRE